MDSSNSLEDCYFAFTGGAREMDGRQFAKFCKDCGLLDKKLTAIDVDLLFTRIKDVSERKITYSQFESCLGHIASRKGTSKEVIFQTIREAGGPKFQQMKIENNKDVKPLFPLKKSISLILEEKSVFSESEKAENISPTKFKK